MRLQIYTLYEKNEVSTTFMENKSINSLPTPGVKYKNPFCQTSKKVGSYTRVFTVLHQKWWPNRLEVPQLVTKLSKKNKQTNKKIQEKFFLLSTAI